jgi:hypothetical protein
MKFFRILRSSARQRTVMHHFLLFLLFVLVPSPIVLKGQMDETTLFNADGVSDVYISFSEDEPTVYMWSGKPVAYLASSVGGGFNVYGFNGKHLGWYVSGIVRDHKGRPVCGVYRVVPNPKPVPLRSQKQLLPQKSSKQVAPLRPLYKRQWSSTPCGLFLSQETTP